MRTKFFAVFAVLAAFIVLTLSGCATYWAKGVMPNLGDSSSLMYQDNLSIKMGDGLTVIAYPVVNEKEVDKYFDEDLLGKGILPIFVEIKNEGATVNLVAATLKNGGTIPAMTPGDLYGVIKRDWVGRATFWMFPTYFVGAPISALATYITNKRIQQDLEGVEGDKGKLLKFGKVEKGVTTGFVCFKGLTSPPKGELKLIFQNNDGKLLEYNLDIKG